jgi:hypothetical protein
MALRTQDEAELIARSRIAQKTIQQTRKALRRDVPDAPHGQDCQEEGMLRQANPSGHHGGQP